MNPTYTPIRKSRLGRYLGLSYVLAGAVFLFDPFIGVIDLLPDCIGYLLMLWGLYRLSDLDDRLAEASKGMRNLALVGLARIVAMLLAFGLVSPSEQPVFILLLLFTLGVLDCIVLIPMWKQMCGGLLYLGSRNDATTMFDRRTFRGRTGRRNAVERYTAASAVFFVLREILVILPELTVLSHEKGGVEPGEGTRYYDFVGLFRGMGILLSLVLGIIWLVMTVRFIKKLKQDKPFFDRLSERYRAEILPRNDLFAMRAVRASLVCLIVATVLSMDLYVDGINILPDVLTAVLLALSVLFIRPYAGKNWSALLATVAYGLSAAFTWALQLDYFRLEDTLDIFRKEEIYARWENMVLLQALTALLYALALGLILRSLYRMVKKYTGLHAFREGTSYAAERTEAIHRLIRKKLIVVGVLFGLVIASTLFRWGVVPRLPEWEAELSIGADAQTENVIRTVITTCYQVMTQAYWFIDICIGCLLVGVTVSATGEISDQMEYSYMMKD